MTSKLSPDKFLEISEGIRSELTKIIVGQEEVIRHVLISILAGGHVLLEGVPGLGKTILIRTLGHILDLKFSRIQFTPDLMPADIIGTEILSDQEGQRSFHFKHGPIFSNLVLADEINRASPKTQSSLLEAMQEFSVTVAEHTYSLSQPFFVMATQNPLEMEGTYPLPEAQLDRFLFKVNVPFPNKKELVQIFDLTTTDAMPELRSVASGEDIIAMRQLVREVPIAEHVTEYAARIAIATHPGLEGAPESVREFVRYGASPRGGQALILAGKVNALFEGRFNVAIEDIQAMAPAALRHRLILNFEGLAEGIQPDSIIAEILDNVTIGV